MHHKGLAVVRVAAPQHLGQRYLVLLDFLLLIRQRCNVVKGASHDNLFQYPLVCAKMSSSCDEIENSAWRHLQSAAHVTHCGPSASHAMSQLTACVARSFTFCAIDLKIRKVISSSAIILGRCEIEI